ncbi:hypothetical protein MNBD_BACTEROID06-903 [hydrothermal vent metagenome]|uniref:Methyltransferase type 12 domain-containing protein n=1 Tax=hydrothermal vent metagenome TaxID=652676 RepID=A0A3B0UC27_9ZZZZ
MGFNGIAKYYSNLSRFVFGSTLETAKVALFNKIPEHAKVLIIGGGSGVSLKHLLSANSSIEVDFVESSFEMIKLAKTEIGNDKRANFICKTIETFDGAGYDVIITEFFFDLFKKQKIENLVSTIALKLNINGCWIDTDFRITKLGYHGLVLKAMYMFFKIIAQIEVGKLVEFIPVMKEANFKLKKRIVFKRGLIASCLFVRS